MAKQKLNLSDSAIKLSIAKIDRLNKNLVNLQNFDKQMDFLSPECKIILKDMINATARGATEFKRFMDLYETFTTRVGKDFKFEVI